MSKKSMITTGEAEIPLCSDETVLLSEFAKRKLDQTFISVKNSEVLERLDEGWVNRPGFSGGP